MFSKEAIRKWIDYQADWNYFCSDYLKIKLDQEQQDAIAGIQVSPKTAIASGTSRGKDYLMAAAAICFMYLTPEWDEKGNLVGNTKVILTGPTQRQVEKIIMPEISRIFRNSVFLPGVLTNKDIKTPYEEWFLTAFKADDNNVENWTGFHAVNIFIGVTEATGINQLIFNSIEGNLQGNSRLVLVFNRNVNVGYAAGAMKSPSFSKFRLNSLNAPNVVAKKILFPGQVDYPWILGAIRDWCTVIDKGDMSDIEGDFEFEGQCYRPNDLFRPKVLGLGPKVSDGVLVPMEWIELANKRWAEFKKNLPIDKPLRLGCDIAGMGRDNSANCYRFGDFVEKIVLKDGKGQAIHMEIAGGILQDLKSHLDVYYGRYPQAFLDTIGEGAGTYSRLIELTQEKTANEVFKGRIHSSKFSEAAADGGGNPLKDLTGQYEFLNMRAWLYWAVRDWLDPNKSSKAMLPPDDVLAQELSETMWEFMSNGKIKIESKEDIKKRLKRSPDKADSLALTFWPVPDVDPRPAKRQNVANFFH